MALQFAKKYNGDFISVSDREIVESIPILGKLTGVLVNQQVLLHCQV